MTGQTPEPGNAQLQFDRADAGGGSGRSAGPECVLCHKPITAYYFEAGGKVVCSTCKNKVLAANVSGVAASGFLRAVVFGLGGALAGAALYYGVLVATGYEIGLIAIVVGFMVGFAVRKGAGGRGGRRYQVLALALTYLAIGGTYVPLAMREIKQRGEVAADSSATARRGNATTAIDAAVVTEPPAGAPVHSTIAHPLLAVALGLAALAALAAAMPVLVVVFGFPQSLISALIIGFALQQAWRVNRRVKVTFAGPFKVGTAPMPRSAPGV
jgi:hypothetical protein